MSTIVRPPSGPLTTRTRRPPARRFTESRLAPDTAAMAWRSWLTMLRTPAEFFDVLIQPVLFTVMFGELLGGAISGDVRSYLPILVPGLVMTNVLTTCQSVGVDLREDMDKGVFDRFRVMPMSRLAPLLGPMTTDLLRYGVCSALTLATGAVMGYRPGNGWWGGLGAVVLATGCAWAISWLFLLLGTLFPSAQAVTSFNTILLFPLCYLSNAMVPIATLPHWLKVFAEHNPVSYTVSALRYALDGTAGTGTAGDLRWAVLGCLVVVAVAAPLTVRRYQRPSAA